MKTRFPALAVALSAGLAQAALPALQLKPIAIGQFFSPVVITHAGDGSGRMFIVDQRGKIHILEDGAILPTPFLDIGAKLTPESAFDERGLLGLAFHPDYAVDGTGGEGKFYIFYSAPSPNAPGTGSNPVNCRSVVAEYQVSENPNLADPLSERVLLAFDKPQANHNGGEVAFGPVDDLLYISTGDGGGGGDDDPGHTGSGTATVLGNAQDLTVLHGKVLRIDPLGTNGPGGQYGIPAGNPFVGAGGGVREEIFAYGLRNPWRFSFDRGPGGTNRLFLADVGQGRFEEVDLITAGGNYGWRRYEATEDFSTSTPSTGPYIDPIAAYAHPGSSGSTGFLEIGVSATGGFVYRGSAFPALQGKYVFGDWHNGSASPNGTLLGLEENPPGTFTLSIPTVVGGNPIGRYIQAFGTDESHELYVGTKTVVGPSQPEPGGLPSGQLFQIVPGDAPILFSRRETWVNQFFLPGTYLDPKNDGDFDRIDMLLEYAWDLDPSVREELPDYFNVSFDIQAGTATVYFRRDPRAVDLDYLLQTSIDLTNWIDVVSSVDGAAPTGAAFVSENTDPVNAETLRVVAEIPANPASQPQGFVRLCVRRP